jgi:drug/metabolite transporter (DMT)-like permease
MSSEQSIVPSNGRPLSPGAVALMLMLCLSWGFNQIAVKLALPDIPPMLQAMIRSAGALPVLLLIAKARGVKIFASDGTLVAGLFAGLLFGLEFVLIFRGLLLTSASRAVVFLYTAPFFVALGSYQFLGERLRASQWGGLGLSFAGVALAIGVPQANVDANVLLGDLMIVAGGALWAATTLLVKATALLQAPPEKALGYQVALSIPILGAAVWISGETITPRPAGAVADGLSGHLGGRIDVSVVVHAGQNLFRQQVVGVYLHHPAVWRGGELFHHARHPDPGVRRRGAIGDCRAVSGEQAQYFRAEGRARSQRSGVRWSQHTAPTGLSVSIRSIGAFLLARKLLPPPAYIGL